MAIIKYSLDNGRIPSYISDGGYFLNSSALDGNDNVTLYGGIILWLGGDNIIITLLLIPVE